MIVFMVAKVCERARRGRGTVNGGSRTEPDFSCHFTEGPCMITSWYLGYFG